MSTQTRQYKQLTLGQRYQIEALLGKDHFQNEIAEAVGISEGSLSRELQRNTGDNGYCAETAHSLAIQRRKSARKHSKTDERQMPIIEKGLLLGWSPENISCRMKLEVPEIALSHTSVYSRIAADKAQGGALYKKLPRFGKRRCKGGKRKAGRFLIPNRVDISERPEVVELQSRVGDWEGDKMYGQDAHLVTLVDRKSRYTLIDKVEMVDNLNCKVQVQVTDASIVQAVKSPTKYLVVQMFGLKLVLNWRHVDVPEYLISPLTTDFRKISIGVVKASNNRLLALPVLVVFCPASSSVRVVYGLLDVIMLFYFKKIMTVRAFQFTHHTIISPITIATNKFRPTTFWQTIYRV